MPDQKVKQSQAWEISNGNLVLFGITLAMALQRGSSLIWCPEQLDLVELFSGVGHIVVAATRRGYRAEGSATPHWLRSP
jgi:hypothetical protein